LINGVWHIESHAPIHPGEILLEDFLKPMGIAQYRLAKFFGTDQQSWMNLQTHCDLAE